MVGTVSRGHDAVVYEDDDDVPPRSLEESYIGSKEWHERWRDGNDFFEVYTLVPLIKTSFTLSNDHHH